MAVSFNVILFCSLLFISSVVAKTSTKPKGLVLPVVKDPSTLQYVTRLFQRTPSVPLSLTLDLGGQALWVDCQKNYISTTYRPSHCGSAQCSLVVHVCLDCIGAPKVGCNNNTCFINSVNTVSRIGGFGELDSDVVAIESSDGRNPGKVVSVPNFSFFCSVTANLQGLAKGVTGMAGLGRSKVSLPSQFDKTFGLKRKFAICLSSSPSPSQGVVLFGNGPYHFLPNVDASTNLIYTPLILNPINRAPVFFNGEPSFEYYIGVQSIKINGNPVPLNKTLLSIDKKGQYGTKISTVNPYTVLESSIYNAVVGAFVKALPGVPRVAAVAPFGACFSSKNISSTRLGPGVPTIDLVLQNEVIWSTFGSNSMVQVSNDVLCLGFVNGGVFLEGDVKDHTAIIIGGHQIEDNLLQFDLGISRLGFSSSLLSRQTTCANFNFTSTAQNDGVSSYIGI